MSEGSQSPFCLLIFDLDGTLIDSSVDLANAVNATRARLGLPPMEHAMVYSYVGNGAPVLIRKALGPEYPDQVVASALDYFMQHYRAHMLDNTAPYPGVREALDQFREAGIPMAVLTNKPVGVSQAIVDGLGLHQHFRSVYGGNSFEQKKPHPVGIETLMAENGASREGTLMVGDSAVDVQTARNAKVAACGVTWGFQPETFAAHPPDFLVGTAAELAARVIGHG
jgi:phosphoglycolate phosphatase